MKLSNKFTLWFLGIVFLVTPVSMYISYCNIKKKIDGAEITRMKNVNDTVAAELRKGEAPERYTYGRPIAIDLVTSPFPRDSVVVKEYSILNRELKQRECRLDVTSFYHINGRDYKISSYNYVTKSDQILSGMLQALLWKMLLVAFCVVLTTRMVSRRVLASFRQTMKTIHGFNLKQKEKISFPKTTTKEFAELNGFLRKMTDKIIEDYASLKEFSENASHELQTPLAVLRSKLELLTETDISGEQAALIADMQNAVEKLSQINRSLLLLTKLENQEYESFEKVKFCKITKDILKAYEDRIEMKGLTIRQEIDNNIYLQIHPALGDILLNNLIGNAIRHNVQHGLIELTLRPEQLVIKNTGLPPKVPTEELFQRFKKSNQSSNSLGLGLAIVRQICEASHFGITYQYIQDMHTVTVRFNEGVNTH